MQGYEILKIIKDEYPQSPSLERTRAAIGRYKNQLDLIKDPKTSDPVKQRMAARMLPVQAALKRLKETIPEDKFLLFYKHKIDGKTIRSIAADYGCDEKTVTRARNMAIKKLAVIMYSDLVIAEILTVGW